MNTLYVSEELIEKIKDSNDIIDVISETVPLKKSGRNYWGLCPFHHEKTPSFSVTQEKQIFKCFGCGEGGNVITFIMKTQNLDFHEALRVLADRAKIPLVEDSPEKKRQYDKQELYYKMHVDAARFFFHNLNSNDEVKAYLYHRGLTDKSIRTFGLGYAKNSWDSLLAYLKGKNYKEEDILRCGLVSKSEKGKVYDRFRNRIIFPVFDIRGRVIAFGARVLDDSKPKYLNSPETPIYNKGTHLYGLNFAKKHSKEKSLIIVEGYMDCISLHQAGITNVVASLGTAMTKIQGRLLQRNSDEVFVCYDADVAGQMATLRGLDILRGEGVKVRVVQIPKGKDPDDYIQAHGLEAFRSLMNKALPLIEYRLYMASLGRDFQKSEDRIIYLREVGDILNDLDPIEKDVYIQKAEEIAGTGQQALQQYMEQTNKRNSFREEMVSVRPVMHIESAHIKAERSLLKILAENPTYLGEEITLSDFSLPAHRKIFEIMESFDGEKKRVSSYVESRCDDVESSKEWTMITQMVVLPDVEVDVQIEDYLKTVHHYQMDMKVKQLRAEIRVLEKEGKYEESMKLGNELIEIQKTLGRY